MTDGMRQIVPLFECMCTCLRVGLHVKDLIVFLLPSIVEHIDTFWRQAIADLQMVLTILFGTCFSLKIVLILRKWSSKRLIQALDTPELAEWYFFL